LGFVGIAHWGRKKMCKIYVIYGDAHFLRPQCAPNVQGSCHEV